MKGFLEFFDDLTHGRGHGTKWLEPQVFMILVEGALHPAREGGCCPTRREAKVRPAWRTRLCRHGEPLAPHDQVDMFLRAGSLFLRPRTVPRFPCRLENNFEAELQRTGGAQRKHTRPQPNQVRTVSPRRAVQSSRSSIQDAAKRLARRVEVLAIEEIVDADLRLERQAIPPMDWFDLPSEL